MQRIARGFSLIELVVVLGLVALLTMIAVPSYRQHMMAARRHPVGDRAQTLGVRDDRFYRVGELDEERRARSVRLYSGAECRLVAAQ